MNSSLVNGNPRNGTETGAIDVGSRVAAFDRPPTIWGLDPVAAHDYYWAARGICVVRTGEKIDLPTDAELFLLTDSHTLAIFRLAALIETLSWVKPDVLFVRMAGVVDPGYREVAVIAGDGSVRQIKRLYSTGSGRAARLALTPDRELAAVWQLQSDRIDAWRRLRAQALQRRREVQTVTGRVYGRERPDELARLINDLMRIWDKPASTVRDVLSPTPGVWIHKTARVGSGVQFIGTAWVGAGRVIEDNAIVIGPAVLWDDPALVPPRTEVAWRQLEPLGPIPARKPPTNAHHRRRAPVGKRLFDIVFASIVLLFTLPLYPFIMLAIWLEDGRPFFFIHRRQTLGGREFSCIKFRSMRRDAEQIKKKLVQTNAADGPQFFMVNDPRLTVVGRILRKTNIDELPQFINVLLGDMSVVGPRPSPNSENQYNPAWREARLSVRAGITGLWQVCRTRRPGLDFQEWIKYDLQYINNLSWRQDLKIIILTIRMMLRGGTS